MVSEGLGWLDERGLGNLRGAVLLADGRVVTGSTTGLLRWTSDGAIEAVLGRAEVGTLALAADGRRLVVAEPTGALAVVDAFEGTRRAIPGEPAGWPWKLDWSGERIAVAHEAHAVLVDPEDGSVRGPMKVQRPGAIVSLPTGLLAALDERAVLVDERGAVGLPPDGPRPTAIAASPDGAVLVVARGAELRRYAIAPFGPPVDARVSSPVRRLALADDGVVWAGLEDGRIVRWRPGEAVVDVCRLEGRLPGETWYVIYGALHPAWGRALAWSRYYGRVEAFDLQTGRRVGEWGRFGEVTRAEVVAAGRAVVTSACWDGQNSFETLQLWDTAAARPLATVVDEQPPLGAWIVDAPRGRIVAFDEDGLLGVWSIATGERTATIDPPGEGDEIELDGLMVLGVYLEAETGRVVVELEDGGWSVDVDAGVAEVMEAGALEAFLAARRREES